MRISDWSSDVCSSDLVTASCLQPDRANPERGTDYSIVPDSAGKDRITLHGRTADGREMTLPVDRYLAVTAEREHLAVKLSVPNSVMKEHVLTDLLKIGRAPCRERVGQYV